MAHAPASTAAVRHSTHWEYLWIYGLHAAGFAVAGLLIGRATGGDWNAGVQLAASWLVWGVLVRTVLVWHITRRCHSPAGGPQ